MEKLQECLEYIRSKTDFVPEIAVVLGSGLGELAEKIETVCSISYSEIPGFPVSTVEGHRGRFVFGTINQIPVAMMQGRIHFYEGYSMQDVVLPIRMLKLMGTKAILLTNAAGGINPAFRPGDLMMLRGHISSFVPSPLIGRNLDALGTRFPDMSHVYDPALSDAMRSCAQKLRIPLQEGVYVQASGPNYETPEEIKMFGILGADAVGMSTACEAMAAVHAGMRVCGVSCITNMAAGISQNALSHTEVQETADRVAKQFQSLVSEWISATPIFLH